MNFSRKLLIVKCVIGLSTVPLLIWSYAAGPVPGVSGVPGESTCAQAGCHAGTSPSPDGRVELTASGGSNYRPGEAQTITVRVSDPQARVYGFQLTARRVSNLQEMAGAFAASAGQRTICSSLDFREAPKSGATCAAATPLEFVSHSEPSSSNTFTVNWTAPSADMGEVRLFVAANAANGNGQNTGDRIYTANVTLTPQAGGGQRPTISSGGVVNSFSFRPNLASGQLFTIFGNNLSNTTRGWEERDFNGRQAPTELDGVRVLVNGQPGYVNYVSPTQVNAQAPTDSALGEVRVEVVGPSGTSEAVTMTKMQAAPGLLAPGQFLVDGKQYVAAFHPDLTTFVGREGLVQGLTFRPARAGDTIVLYGVGFGPTNPEAPAGQKVQGAPQLSLPYQFRFGDTVATVQFAGMVQDLVGLYQFNLTVPNVPAGDHELRAEVGGISTGQSLFITVQ
jgi:uncharacterized protein (TIGR03437 family)